MMADQRWMDAKASRQERQAAFEEKELVVLMQAGLRGVVQVCVSELCSRSGQKWKVRMCLLVGRMSRDVLKLRRG
jgi:hypothetical protein